MATGDGADFSSRIRSVLPTGWFPVTAPGQPSLTPTLDALLAGLSSTWSSLYALLTYTTAQTRIATATDVFLDMTGLDYFGTGLRRRNSEVDAGYRLRIKQELLRPRNTRAAIVSALVNLTGRAPIIFEPARATDTGGYGTTTRTPWAYNYDMTVGVSGGSEWTNAVSAAAPYLTTNKAGVAGLVGPALPATNGAAFTVLVEWSGGASNDVVWGVADASGFANTLYIWKNGTAALFFTLRIGGATAGIVGVSYTPGATTRAVLSFSANGTGMASVNGSAPQTFTFTGAVPTWINSCLGCGPFNGTLPPTSAMAGAPTRLTVYPSARSAADVQRLSVAGYQPGLEVVAPPWTNLAFGMAGGYGSTMLPYQAFVTAFRPIGAGIANLPGYANPQGAYGVGTLAYGSVAMIGGQVTDAEIYAKVAATMPCATIAWTAIRS